MARKAVGDVEKMQSAKRVKSLATDIATSDQFHSSDVEVKRVIKPVQNAISILRYLTETGEPSTVTQISRALRLNTSTCFNILRTLGGEQIITFDTTRKTYQIGIGIMKIAAGAISEEGRLAAARPLIRKYAERHNSTVCIWRRMSADRNILVATEHPGGVLRITMEVGQKMPVLLGSTGRVMLHHLGLSKAELRAEFKKLRWHRQPSFESFLEGAREAKEHGYGVDDGNFTAGILTVSAPVFNAAGAIFYSLTSITFRDQHANKDPAEMGTELVALAGELGSVLY